MVKRKVTLSLDPDIADAIGGKAQDGRISRSRAIELALAQHLGVPAPESHIADVEGSSAGGRPKRKEKPAAAPAPEQAKVQEVDDGGAI